MTCAHPEFIYNHVMRYWEACVHCRRLAWEHEQADPLRDLRNYARMLREDGHPIEYPPAMRPQPDRTAESDPG